ncbi:hypothetical protein LRY64_04280 [Candidatus Woesebacteria bacterium]|nr:hypothetical protein [Candidatus Woesebacteria bacterium]
MPIKFIYFDIGGVFVDHMSAWGSVARELGVSQNDVVSLFLKHVAELDRGTLSWNAFETILYQELHPRRNLSAPLNVTFVSNFTKIEATHAFAHEIAKKTPIGLLSNISADILTLLKKADLIPDLPYHAVIASGALGHIKPEKEIFTVALEHVPCLPQESSLSTIANKTSPELENLACKHTTFRHMIQKLLSEKFETSTAKFPEYNARALSAHDANTNMSEMRVMLVQRKKDLALLA